MSRLVSDVAGQQTDDHSDDGVAAVAKAGAILHAFTSLTPVLSTRQLAARTGIPRSTVHGICRSLVGAGILERASGRGYRLGPALVELGGQVISRIGLVDAAEGVLERVPRRDGTEAHLGQLVDGWIVYLDRASGVLRVPMNNRIGLRVPAARTGCGRAALALLDPDDARERMARAARAERHSLGADALDELAADLRVVKRDGYAVSSVFQAGRTSVAAGVVDMAGNVCGAISIAGPQQIFTPQLLRSTSADVVAAAKRISERMPVQR
jgi:IclR family acetate operon transcriptional repressor